MTIAGEKVIPQRGRRLAVIGTSLVQHNDLASAGKVSHHSRGWLRWAHVLSNGIFYCPVWFDSNIYLGWEPAGVANTTRFFRGLNAGVSGQTFSQIDSRKSYLTTLDCDIIVIDDGTNDVSNFDGPTIEAARESLVDYYLSFGKIVILMPILARTTTAWASATQIRKRVNYINSASRHFANSRRNCYFFDWNSPWVDYTQTTDTIPKSGYVDPADGTHYLPVGAYFVGKAFAAFLATILPAAQLPVWSVDDAYDATDNPQGNYMANPYFASTGGVLGTGASGTVAGTYRVERSTGATTVACALINKADGRGKWQQMVFTQSGAAVDLLFFRPSTTNTTHGTPNGGWLKGSMRVKVPTAYAGFRGISLTVQDQGANGLNIYGMEPHQTSTVPDTPWQGVEAWEGLIETPPFQPVFGGDVRFRLEIRIDTTVAGTCEVDAGEPELRQVASPLTVLGTS